MKNSKFRIYIHMYSRYIYFICMDKHRACRELFACGGDWRFHNFIPSSLWLWPPRERVVPPPPPRRPKSSTAKATGQRRTAHDFLPTNTVLFVNSFLVSGKKHSRRFVWICAESFMRRCRMFADFSQRFSTSSRLLVCNI